MCYVHLMSPHEQVGESGAPWTIFSIFQHPPQVRMELNYFLYGKIQL